MNRHLLLLTLPFSVLVACNGKANGGGGGSDDTGGTGEGGGEGGGITYEEGCITVDGGGGYAWINDAITVADEGSTINLCASSTHEEEVIVDKGVSIVGPGAGEFLLVAPTNTNGFTITADGATLSGVGIDSTRNGIAIVGAAGVDITGVEVVAAGNWGISAEDATGLTLSDSALVGNGYGGISVDGGEVVATGMELTANTAYGAFATNGGVLRMEASSISDTAPTDPDNAQDGFGAYGEEGARLTLSGNTWTNNLFAAVRTEEADAFLDGETISGSAYGVILRLGDISIADVSIEGVSVMGALLVTLGDLNVVGLDVATDPELSVSYAYNDWGSGDSGVNGTGVVAVADIATIDQVSISGFNNCGLLIQPASSDTTGVATVSNTTIENTGRYGVYSSSMETTFTDSTVTGTRLVDTAEERYDEAVGQDVLCYYVNYYAGVYNIEGAIDWVGGSIADNEGWGVSSIYGTISVDGAAVSSNNCAGVLGFQGTMAVANSTLSGHTASDVINSNSDTLVVLDNNTFENNRSEDGFQDVYDYMDTSGYRITYDYGPGFAQVNDVRLFEVSESVITDNSFTNGDRGVLVYGGGSTVSGNSWSGYRSTVLSTSSFETAADVEMSNNTIAASGGLLVDCSSSSLEVSDLTVSGATHYQYNYDYTIEYSDGQTSTSSSTGTSGNIGLRGYECNLYVDTATFSNLEGNAVELLAYSGGTSTAELNDVTVLNAGLESTYADSAITANTYGGDVSLYVDGLSVTNANSDHAIELYASSGTMLLDGDDILINGATSNGLNTYAGTGATLTVDVDGMDIQNTLSDGVYAFESSTTISSSTISTASASGILLTGGTAAITDTVLESNTDYGMECEGEGEQTCSGVSHLTNGLGEQTGCDVSCGEEAGGDDTGTPEP